MRNRWLRFFALLAIFFLVFGCAKKTADLYPLANGNFWEYQATQGKAVLRITGTELVGDKNCFVGELAAYFPGVVEGILMKEYYYRASDGIYLPKRHFMNGMDIIYNPPLKFLQFPTKIGDKWDCKGNVIIKTPTEEKTMTANQSFEVMSKENMSFADKTIPCFKVKWSGEFSDKSRVESYRWYAEGIGLVKEDQTTYAPNGQSSLSSLNMSNYHIVEEK